MLDFLPRVNLSITSWYYKAKESFRTPRLKNQSVYLYKNLKNPLYFILKVPLKIIRRYLIGFPIVCSGDSLIK